MKRAITRPYYWFRGLLASPSIWLLGLRECRSDATAHFDYPEIDHYDSGRDFGRFTLALD